MSKEGSAAVHKEVSLLLPWYVNGSLSTSERERVQAHLDACADCRDEAALSSDMMAAVQQHEATPILPVRTAAGILDSTKRRGTAIGSRLPEWGVAAGFGLAALLILAYLALDSAVDALHPSDVGGSARFVQVVTYVTNERDQTLEWSERHHSDPVGREGQRLWVPKGEEAENAEECRGREQYLGDTKRSAGTVGEDPKE